MTGIGAAIANFVGKVLKVKTATGGYINFNGKRHYTLSTAITANVTPSNAPANSFGTTTHATGGSKWFVSDGTKWQSMY